MTVRLGLLGGGVGSFLPALLAGFSSLFPALGVCFLLVAPWVSASCSGLLGPEVYHRFSFRLLNRSRDLCQLLVYLSFSIFNLAWQAFVFVAVFSNLFQMCNFSLNADKRHKQNRDATQ